MQHPQSIMTDSSVIYMFQWYIQLRCSESFRKLLDRSCNQRNQQDCGKHNESRQGEFAEHILDRDMEILAGHDQAGMYR